MVFGGGPVGLRKANYLAKEAEVVVVSRDFVAGFDPSIELVRSEIAESIVRYVEWADLVVAATNDPGLNEEIGRQAARAGRYFNSADRVSTFLIPSVVSRTNYQVAISTLGRSPAMARYLRERLEGELGVSLDHMVDLQEKLRAEAREVIGDQRSREEFLWSVLEDRDVWDLLERDPQAALEEARRGMVRWHAQHP